MGGLALKRCFTRRYQKDEFEKITPVIQEKLLKMFTNVGMPKYFKSKESFGDADFVVEASQKSSEADLEQFFIEEFQSKEIFKNGHVYSIEYNELQVDVIMTPTKYFETSLNYFAWNDLGNLIGKIAHRFGLKWGHKGLVYTYNLDGKVLGEITVTRNAKDALTFLGFDYDRYTQGFDSIQEIYDYVISCKYFVPKVFQFDQMNRTNRERDNKRTTYLGFIEFINNLETTENTHYFYHDKKVYLGLIDFNFPGFLKEYRQLEKKEERKRKVHSLFNGALIMEHFDLKGKELGDAISKFKNSFSTLEHMEDWILDTDDVLLVMDEFKFIVF